MTETRTECVHHINEGESKTKSYDVDMRGKISNLVVQIGLVVFY